MKLSWRIAVKHTCRKCRHIRSRLLLYEITIHNSPTHRQGPTVRASSHLRVPEHRKSHGCQSRTHHLLLRICLVGQVQQRATRNPLLRLLATRASDVQSQWTGSLPLGWTPRRTSAAGHDHLIARASASATVRPTRMLAVIADVTVLPTPTMRVDVIDRRIQTATGGATARLTLTGIEFVTENETKIVRRTASGSETVTGRPDGMVGDGLAVGEEEAAGVGGDRTTYHHSTARIGRWRKGWDCDGPIVGTLLGRIGQNVSVFA